SFSIILPYLIVDLKLCNRTKIIENDFLANGIRLYHSRRFTTRAQPDAFVRISLSSNNLEILASGLSIVKEKIKKYEL
ncbi:hypothetical protein BSY88_11135, partial [Enterococcus faecium]